MAKEPKAKGTKGGLTSATSLLAWFVAAIVVVLFHATLILLAVGMLPTVAAYIVDRNPAKYTAKSVGYLNFCGCLPSALELWRGANDWQAALVLLQDLFTWLVMYSSAAVGWLIVFSVPPVVAAYLAVTNDVKEKAFKKRQKELVEEWGANVRHRALGSTIDESESSEAQEGSPEAAAAAN